MAAVVAIACSASERSGFEPDQAAPERRDENEAGSGPFGPGDAGSDAPSELEDECRKIDVVFVVDDSGSMGSKQQKLRANLPRFVDVLDQYRTKAGTTLDYRLAVTSTDMTRTALATGGKGGFVTSPKSACNAGPARAWLERTDPTVAATFACRASLGTAGSANEQPLAALMSSVTDRLADQNRDFLRDDALLAFVILTDEDDSSGTTPSPAGLVTKLDQVKTLRGRWAGAVISGPRESACGGGSTSGGAEEAPRMHDFVDGAVDPSTGKNNVIWRTTCQDDFDSAVKDALDTFALACRDLPALPR